MKKLYLTHITSHATLKFKERYLSKTGKHLNSTSQVHALVFETFDRFLNDNNSYVELIENIENFKDKHTKFAEKRKQRDDTIKILDKELQLVFIFDKDFKNLLTCRIDTGKFKRRRTQHEVKILYKEALKQYIFSCPRCSKPLNTY